MFKVIFIYDDPSRKWKVNVEGAVSEEEARQGFTAVLLTCKQISPSLQHHALVEKEYDRFVLTPAI